MICLFVSFEVKSKSDDLTGLVLKCKKIDEMNILEFTKFDSSSDDLYERNKITLKNLNVKNGSNIVIKYSLDLNNDDERYNIYVYPYRTTLNTVFLKWKYYFTNDEGDRDFKINESKLSRSKLDSSLVGKCEIYEDDFKVLLEETLKDKINNLKSKQKI